ncbi:MAG: orotate phosphoribosyltransferase [Clostridiales bacterium]|nr:orotate phosphoribosyltransferase [Clostridiales bacterium]
MDRRELAKSIYSTAHLTGTFTLRSGQISHEYFDKYLFEVDSVLLAEIARLMAERIPAGTDVLAGLELGGVPLATALSLHTGIPAAFVRKKAKEYGMCKAVEGGNVASRRVCVVEDMVTTGGAIIDGVWELRALGAAVDSVVCVILRNADAADTLAGHGLTLRPAYTMEEIMEICKNP